ncbi:MAG: hypothetical protein IKU29_10805, partial [Parabacteroides sp.]|nr:hypothetical protein [Parabacteroides sp.]
MKRLYLIYIGIVGCLCFSACSKNEDSFLDERMGNISLSAVVDELKIVTKTLNDNAYTGSVPSPDKNLEAAVWFSLESGCYPESLSDDETDETKIALSAETNLPIHGVINFQSGTATFPESNDGLEPKYPVNNQPVYCVGLYPHEGWTVDESATKATHAITGTEDLMFAPEISGSWNQHFEIQRYRHLLTWLKICVCTTTPEAGKYWGKLKNITLKEMSD